MEESLRSNVYRERKERHILVALSIVVGVQCAQSCIEVGGKCREITGRLLELNEPLMSPLPFVEEEARRCRVFAHTCSAITTAGFAQSRIGIGDHHLLAKGIDEVLRAARDDDAVGVERGEAHRIADDIAVETTQSRDDHGVVTPELDLLQTESTTARVVARGG